MSWCWNHWRWRSLIYYYITFWNISENETHFIHFHINGLVQERCNSIDNTLELHFFALTHRHNGWYVWQTQSNEICQIEGILPKGPYPPCLRMADRALLAGYPRNINRTLRQMIPSMPYLHGLMIRWTNKHGLTITQYYVQHDNNKCRI